MGGGKSRTLCEEIFDAMLDYPGLRAVIARNEHTSITETTKKTMMGQVIPPDLLHPTRPKKESGGEDWFQLWNGSTCNFIGLDNPLRWYSSEIGYIAFDESQEIQEEAAVRLITRLRQPGMPNRAIFTFNPSSPGHWLQKWFLLGGQETEFGFRKEELFATDAIAPIGDCDFFFAKATDNIHLPEGYVEQTLGGLPLHLRRRLLDGFWEYTEGNSFFDAEDLSYYQGVATDSKPIFTGTTVGDPIADFEARRRNRKSDDPPRFRPGSGNWTLWARPDKNKRYVMSVDTSSGGSYDYSAIQIVCVEDFEQVAEFQAKISPSELAIEAYRAGRVFNNATAVPEITGGWGFSVIQELTRLHYPSTYTRRLLDRLTKKYTDVLGWDTTSKTRAHMLDTLYRVLSEREFVLHGMKTLNELATFVYGKNDKPQAQEGCNDDLAIALAIAVTVAVDRPRQVKKQPQRPYEPQFAATGY